jgi:hypothetical protein
MPSTDKPYFFIHIMKTAGTTFRWHTRKNFPLHVYPSPALDDMYTGYTSVDTLLSLPAERRKSIRAYGGHFPYIVTELLGIDLVTTTILRDPVDRTISFLKQCKRQNEHHRDLPLEAIYEDAFFYPTLVHNHQAKVFSMDQGDKLETIYDIIDVDDRRLAQAKDNLAKVDVVGLSEHFDEFLAVMTERYDWTFDEKPKIRESTESWAASDSLRRRIADDNAADVELYDFSRDLYERVRPRSRL